MSTATKTTAPTKRRLTREEAQLERALHRLANLLAETETAARELRSLLATLDAPALGPSWPRHRANMTEDLTSIAWSLWNFRSSVECW